MHCYRIRRSTRSLTILAATLAVALQQAAPAETPPGLELLYAGKSAQAAQTLQASLKRQEEPTARYALGIVQFIGAVENLGQAFHRHGLRNDRLGMAIPFLRLPIPRNSNPQTISYERFRAIMQQFVDEVGEAEQTLAVLGDEEVKVEVDLARIQLKLGSADDELMALRNIAAMYLGGRRRLPAAGLPSVTFDRADVAWLRGYCHLLSAMAESYLAYDSRATFERTAQLFFPRVQTPYAFLLETTPDSEGRRFDWSVIADAIALIHLIQWDVTEPERLKRAHAHLLHTIELSRECWERILRETDNDQEWIPAPNQQSAIGVPVSQAQVDAWLEFTREIEKVLQGELLVPFWRGDGNLGVNLKKVFLEPRPFDLVLWVQGTAATPYLEKGPQTKEEFWARLQRVFRGQFIGFAMWFN